MHYLQGYFEGLTPTIPYPRAIIIHSNLQQTVSTHHDISSLDSAEYLPNFFNYLNVHLIC